MKIILSIIVVLFITAPTFISIFIFNRKKQIKWIYGGALLTLIATFVVFLILMEIRIPNNDFNEKEFKHNYTEIFKLKFPSSANILKKEYKKDSGLFGHEYWTVRLIYSEDEYNNLLNYVKDENEMLLQDYSENPKPDCITGKSIIYSIATNYMNPWNYEIYFFEDRETIRLKMIIYGD
jgi:hypothetical protein